ncbi:MAG: iron-containing alcohol dehydrogenase [Deltaproteobacteria bacterium]|nr:iron-containing alcohol dehydrogenase [Deltaproteobacteria bacterium]
MSSLFELLGESIQREFAQRRDTIPRACFYCPDAPELLAKGMLAETKGRTALVISDVRTRDAAGGPCLEAMERAGWSCTELVVPDGTGGASPVCDDVTRDRLKAILPPADVFVAVGAGVVNDLTKWLASEASVPYGVLATAASMNGYSAANVAPSIKGVKSLFRAQAPRILAAIPSVIERAPWNLTASGLGDVIAKPVSTADWLMNHDLFGESFSQAVADIINRLEPSYLGHPQALAGKEPEAIRALFDALVWSGCAMTLQGSSLPASGGEHLISHTLDMLAHVDGSRHDLHGRQVGVGTIFAAALYQRMIAIDLPRIRATGAPFDPGLWGSIAPAVESEHAAKHQRIEQACTLLSEPGCWSRLRSALSPILRRPEDIKDCLAKSGAAHRIADIGCSRDRFLTAVLNCGAMRARFTSIDLAWVLGVLPDAAETIVDDLLS